MATSKDSKHAKRQTKKKANKKENIFVLLQKCFRSGGDENEKQMTNNVNSKEMRFVIRNLVDVDSTLR